MNRAVRLARLVLLTFLIAPGRQITAQESKTQRPDLPTFTAEVNRVYLPVVVLGERKENINFRVLERKGAHGEYIERKIDRIERPGKLPIRAGFLVDTSTSASVTKQFQFQIDVAQELSRMILRSLLREGKDDRVFVADFYYDANDADPKEGIHKIKLNWAGDIKSIVLALTNLKPGGWSPLFGGIRESSLKFLKDVKGDYSTFLVVISDGYNQMPDYTPPGVSVLLSEAVQMAQSAHLAVYTISTMDTERFPRESGTFKQSEKDMMDIAQLTGGRFFRPANRLALLKIADQIRRDIENRYHLEYGLNEDYKSGDEVSIRVEVGEYDPSGRWKKWPNVRPLHRKGYRVTKNN